MSSWLDSVLAAEAIKAGTAARGNTSYSKATISDWQNSLDPLTVGEFGVGDELNGMSQ